MWFWWFMLCSVLLIPVIMLAFGLYCRKGGPKTINWAFGYRTSRSMKNQDTWTFAQQYCGKIWFYSGLVLIPLSILPFFFVIGQKEDIIGNLGLVICFIQLIPLLGSIFFVERALRKTFDKQGNRR